MSDRIAPEPVQGTLAATEIRARRKLMLFYIEERVQRLPVRLVLYTIGCLIGYYAVDLAPALLSYAILLTGDAFDCFMLRTVVRRWTLTGKHDQARHLSTVTGTTQGLFIVMGISVYYFSLGADGNILFVIGALGLGAVNAAIVLPQHPAAALWRLGLYAVTPGVFLAVVAIQSGTLAVFYVTDVAGVMLLFCMIYMLIAFTKSGMKNFKITQDLEAQRAEMQVVNARMDLHQTELQQLSLVARNANDSVIISDGKREIVWVNEAFSRITGYSFDEAKGANICELLTGENQELLNSSDIDIAVEAGDPFRGELPNKTKDGRTIWLDVNLFPIPDVSGVPEFFVSIERDVTETRQLVLEMAKARQSAEEGERTKAEFLANMSHEIRTPLTGVIGMADLLAETKLDAEQTRYADTIRGSSMSLLAIINDILDLSKLDAGRLELHPVSFSPVACVQETIDLLHPSASKKGLEITCEVGAAVPDAIKADDGRIRQIVTNILGNAIKFTETGGIYVRVASVKGTQGDRLVVEVEDTGVGIAKDKQADVFEHFTQAEASTTRKFGGTGLGLSISKHILGVMGGTISVRSDLGAGATFRVEIPYAPAERTLGAAQPAFAANDQPILLKPGLRILVAEDNKTNRFLLKKYLAGQPVDLTFAVDGVEAVEQVQAQAPDLIFMDMSMPRMSGIEATQEIRRLPICQPAIVALTAHAFEAEMQACFDAGMDDFLTKPIRKITFLQWLARFQDSCAAQKEALEIPSDEGAVSPI